MTYVLSIGWFHLKDSNIYFIGRVGIKKPHAGAMGFFYS